MANPKKITLEISVDPADRIIKIFSQTADRIATETSGMLSLEVKDSARSLSRERLLNDFTVGKMPCIVIYSNISIGTKTIDTEFFFNPVWSQHESDGSKLLGQTERYFQKLMRSVPGHGEFFQRTVADDEKIISSILNRWPRNSGLISVGEITPDMKTAEIDVFYDSAMGREDLMVLPTNICYRCDESTYQLSVIVNEGTWNFFKTHEKKAFREAMINIDYAGN